MQATRTFIEMQMGIRNLTASLGMPVIAEDLLCCRCYQQCVVIGYGSHLPGSTGSLAFYHPIMLHQVQRKAFIAPEDCRAIMDRQHMALLRVRRGRRMIPTAHRQD